jgi:hypothetical protein
MGEEFLLQFCQQSVTGRVTMQASLGNESLAMQTRSYLGSITGTNLDLRVHPLLHVAK